jgi:uncharacterized membrane protein YqhA
MTPRIGLARFVAVLGVASSMLLAGVLFLSAFSRAVVLAIESVRVLGREHTLERLIVAAVAHADALLVATGLLIIGFGLYSIFIERVERLPRWLAVEGLDDLKDRLAGIVVVALAVRFFTVALEWTGTGDILGFGLAIAAVILGLTAYTSLLRPHRAGERARDAAAAPRAGVADESARPD